MKTRYREIEPYLTKDGSEIRELMHPSIHGNRNQSLAEARINPGHKTLLHRHLRSEELYHITAGEGMMTLGGEVFPVAVGDTVCIPPGTPHSIENTGGQDLVMLCCSAPPYSHEDTELVADISNLA